MNKTIEKLLDDIYSLDPTLKGHQKELVRLLSEMLENKPEVKIDQSFIADLREKITSTPKVHSFFTLPRFAIAGVIVFLFVLIPIFSGKDKVTKIAINSEITEVGKSAFGSLDISSDFSAPNLPTDGEGLGGGRSFAVSEMSLKSEPSTSLIPVPTDMMVVEPSFYYYQPTYKYVGDDFDVDSKELPVYKKVTDSKSAESFARLLENLNLDTIDLGAFKKLSIKNITVFEDRDYGYEANINFDLGSVNIYKNWLRWPDNYSDCFSRDCIRARNNLSEKEIIGIADKFMADFGINMSFYRQGEVSSRYAIEPFAELQVEEDAEGLYYPQFFSTTVTYQLIVDGQNTYNQGGTPSGLYVEVDLAENKVISVNEITSQTYEKSLYPARTKEEIMNVVLNGGSYNFPMMIPQRSRYVEIGTPKFGLVETWQYMNSRDYAVKLYVPSYISPVLSESFYEQNIIVPAVSGLISEGPLPLPAVMGR